MTTKNPTPNCHHIQVCDVRSLLLVDLADKCKSLIASAESDGITVDDGNVVDLCADNARASLSDIRAALVVAGLAPRFPKATSSNEQ